ncbi:CBS domain-containing protein [Nonomuraea gerenzanensis]|uniref:Inosine-5'-monophosphate dehydrogenase n=1 Tax=Nonomuraea gerenzanensis TaxID=93944 RepID=A0A1M4EEN0_9ACTN|nr:CBS domain-containing protein [Nonomuraea gerenzanensis]UBU08763.1 CBS domain-containing protein [Nonomuraea gerenzanensis]SBO97128.1 Inosine-5'-monophosphate dehydrogenase [Nonomuraea gerenzanensis]
MTRTVENVMTTDVVAVNAEASFHTVAELLIDKGVSGVPVLDDDNRVVGVVSEADLLAKEEFKERYYGDDYRPPLRARIRHATGSEGSGYRKSVGESAGALMTSPAHVTTPDTSVVSAARLMDRYGVKRLPVVDADGRLVGIVSRRDLIKVFLRPDQEIEQEVREALHGKADVAVTDGIVSLSGTYTERSSAITAVRLAENIDGVVAVHDELAYKHDDIADLPMWGGA